MKSKVGGQMTDQEIRTVATAVTSLDAVIRCKKHEPRLIGVDLDNMPISEALLKVAEVFEGG